MVVRHPERDMHKRNDMTNIIDLRYNGKIEKK